jgi:hypothetical protein
MYDDDVDDSYDDDDDYYEDDAFDDGPVDTIACPSCGAEIYEDAERCMHCGDYVVHGLTNPWQGRSLWWLILGVTGIFATIWALAF